jgi:choline dehydrogenase
MQAEEDKAAMISGFRQARKILATEPIASMIISEMAPGSECTSDTQLLDFMEQNGKCAYHPAGTCKMGNDDMAVVDERLRVRGVEGLRVVDASIMPTVTSGNTHAPTVMIGDKGADMIREDWAALIH